MNSIETHTAGIGRPTRALLAVLFVMASACGPEDDARPNEDIKFEAYLDIRGITPVDAAEREREWNRYREKRALVSAILKQDTVDRRLIDAEVENYRTELVLKRHFDRVLERGLSESKLREYYREHAEKFGRIRLRYATFASTDTSDETVEELAQAVRAGESASALAERFEPLAVTSEGREIRYLDALDPELRALFEEKKQGDVIGPLVSNGLVTVYRIEEGPVLEGASFEDVRQQIAFILRNEIRQREIQRLLSDVRTSE